MEPREILVNLIKTKKVDLGSFSYKDLDSPVKKVLLNWLESKNFPIDNPEEIIGDGGIVAWFNADSKLFIFGLSYEEEEQCGGTIILSLEGNTCKYVADTVKCSE